MGKFSRSSVEDGLVASIGCGTVLLWASFWVGVIAVVVHFVSKFW